MNLKFKELEGIDLKGYKPYFKQNVVYNGTETALYFLTKPTQGRWLSIRCQLEDLEFCVSTGTTDTKKYLTVDGQLADK